LLFAPVLALFLGCASGSEPNDSNGARRAPGSTPAASAGGPASGGSSSSAGGSDAAGAGAVVPNGGSGRGGATSGGAAAGGRSGAFGGNGGAAVASGAQPSSRAGESGTQASAGASSAGGAAAGGSAGASAGGGGAAPSDGDYVVAPDGADNAPGTLEQPTTLASALGRVTPGHTIFARGGRYAFAQQITVARDDSGVDGNPKALVPYGTEQPVLDFSAEPYGTGSNPRGLEIDGSFWHVRGLEVLGAADNGIYVAGNGNVIEGCVTHGNRDTGLQLGRASSADADISSWPSNNLILNCESYDNYDAPPGSGENADGFAAKLTVGTGNVFRGCVSHNNIDDGWDLYTKHDTGAIGPVTIDQCISYANGTLTDGTSNANGDRNGFKLGGDDIAVAHVVTRSVAFQNGKNGFTWNSNPGAIELANNLAFDNVEGNFKFGDNSTTTAAVFTNNVSFWTSSDTQSDKAIGIDTPGTNAWWDEAKARAEVAGTTLVVTADDFAVSLAAPELARNADGTPSFAPFALAPASDLVDAGVIPPGALPFDAASYYRARPDLGAVEVR
jgi:hypothetical protein